MRVVSIPSERPRSVSRLPGAIVSLSTLRDTLSTRSDKREAAVNVRPRSWSHSPGPLLICHQLAFLVALAVGQDDNRAAGPIACQHVARPRSPASSAPGPLRLSIKDQANLECL